MMRQFEERSYIRDFHARERDAAPCECACCESVFDSKKDESTLFRARCSADGFPFVSVPEVLEKQRVTFEFDLGGEEDLGFEWDWDPWCGEPKTPKGFKKKVLALSRSLPTRLREFTNLTVVHVRSAPHTTDLDFSTLPSTVRELRLLRDDVGTLPSKRNWCTWVVNLKLLPKLEVLDLIDLYTYPCLCDAYEPCMLRFQIIGRIPRSIRELRVVHQREYESWDWGGDDALQFSHFLERDEDEDEPHITAAHADLEVLDLQRVRVDFDALFWRVAKKLWFLSLVDVDASSSFTKSAAPTLPGLCFLRIRGTALSADLDMALEAALRTADCGACGQPAQNRCGRCEAVVYCNVECQKADWRAHKAVCQAKQK